MRIDKRTDKHPLGGPGGLRFYRDAASRGVGIISRKTCKVQKETDEHLRFYGHRTMNLALDSDPARKGDEVICF
jgi:hypothetical protein